MPVIPILGGFAVIGGLLIWASAAGVKGPGWVFTGFWCGGVVWLSYWYGWRVAWSLQLRENELRWRTFLRSGTVPITEIQRLRPMRSGPSGVVIELAHRRSLLVIAGKGFDAFTAELTRQAPDVPINVSRWTRMFERWPVGRSAYRQRDDE